MTEADIQTAIRLALGQEPGLVLWRNSGGLAMHVDTDGRVRQQRFGLVKGASDLLGILAPSGRFIAIEIKAAKGRLTPEQERFLSLVRSKGGFAAVVRSVEEAKAALDRARRGLDS